MIRHVVTFQWNDGIGAAHISAAAAAIDAFVAELDGVVAYQHGADLGLADGNSDYAIVGDFADQAAYETYRDDPAHKAFIQTYLVGHIANRAAVQYAL